MAGRCSSGLRSSRLVGIYWPSRSEVDDPVSVIMTSGRTLPELLTSVARLGRVHQLVETYFF